MSYFLCGNTGFRNRGCEAIVSATVKLLNAPSGDIFLTTFDKETDTPAAKRLGVNLLPYSSYPTKLHRAACFAIRKLTPFRYCGAKYIQNNLFSLLQKDDICLSVGGDTYCYSRPKTALELNHYTSKHKIKNILWCCSIEKSALTQEILRDLHCYDSILARESLTFRYLTEAGFKNVLPCCDAAFFLDEEPFELPKGFMSGNTVGINISPVVAKEGDLCYQNILALIRYIIDCTDLNVCLIPHVYTVSPPSQDYSLLKSIAVRFPSDRVSMIEEELRCEQLKYLISKCCFLVASRTHASIAAYSTCVPTLVVGYSVKSRGIAADLFGTWQDYVLPFEEIKSEQDIRDTFIRLFEQKENIRQKLRDVLPAYRQTLIDAMARAIPERHPAPAHALCREELCTGCSACASVCSAKAISMQPDSNGFLRPVLDEEKCLNCGSCSRVCPVLNRVRDDQKLPAVYAIQSKDDALRSSSSSGAAFSLLAKAILARGGVVVGAAFSPEWDVAHRICHSLDEADALKTSKYVQSTLGTVFPEVKKLLCAGREVLFSGTPCQIAGLKSYLGNSQEKLTTVDLICHGVPSPVIWRDYCRGKGTISAINFRDKTYGWRLFSLRFSHPDQSSELLDVAHDPYMRCFVSNYTLRSSCFLCPAQQLHRQSDLTLGDFWSVEDILPEMADQKGTSLVLVHSEKGQALLDRILANAAYKNLLFQDAVSENSTYLIPATNQKMQKRFFQTARKLGTKNTLRFFSGSNKVSRIAMGIWRRL